MAWASANNLPVWQGMQISILKIDRLSTVSTERFSPTGLSAAYELRAFFALRFAANKR